MIITKIRLQNWKNFGDVNVAELGKRVFLIGPNAAGKSNFLDALRFLRETALDGLSKAAARRGGIKAIRYLNARSPSDISLTVTLDDRWEYSLSFNTDARDEPLIAGEKVAHLDGTKKILLDRPNDDDKKDRLRLTQTALQQVNSNKEFREIADFFSSIQYRHILPQLVRDPKSFSSWPSHNDPFGRDIVSQIWNTPSKIRASRLSKINAALAAAIPKFKNMEVKLDESTGFPHLQVEYEHWRQHGAYQDESSFSDGALRLLSLFWSIFDAEGPLLLEEPELSLHEAIVRRLPAIFSSLDKTRKKMARQIFVTTHAEALLNDAGVGPREILRLEPGSEGTAICAADETDVRMMEDGLSAADVMLPKTVPPGIEQLKLFDLS